MRNMSKGVEIADCFPIYAVENDLIVNKVGEYTVGYEVRLPEIFTITDAEYEVMHQCWVRALKALPLYTVVCKQDWFTEKLYRAESSVEEKSFLSRSFDNHFLERPYLDHRCYLFLTKTRKGRCRMQSIDTMLVRGRMMMQNMNEKEAGEFLDAAGQMEHILADSGLISLRRLTEDDILGVGTRPGILEKHMRLNQEDRLSPLEDFIFEKGVQVGRKRLCFYTLSSSENLPLVVSTDTRSEAFSTETSNCSLSFAAPFGIELPYDHLYQQYIFIDDSEEELRRLESTAKKMHSLSLISSQNAVNEEHINLFLASAHEHKLLAVRSHVNVIAWSENERELGQVKNAIVTAMSRVGCQNVRENTTDGPVLFWASIPGNGGDFPREETYLTFLENALCFFAGETNYRDSLSPFGIKMTDRLSGRPVHVDLSEIWMEKGIISNRNKFVLGPSGSGKSYYMNHMMRQYYEQGAHIILVDMGNSYEGLCNLLHTKTKGKDGIYYTYTEETPIAFNPFYTDDRVYDIEKRDSLKTLVISLWKREGGELKPSEDVAVENAMNLYLEKIQRGLVTPSFNTFYEFVRDEYDVAGNLRELIEKEKTDVNNLFDIVNFLYVLAPFYRGGTYDYLLNSDKELDLLGKRFIVFEIDKIRDNKVLFPVVTLVIMESYINKMRRLGGIRKVLVLEEAWKAIAKEGMAEYVKYMFKTVRKYFGEITVVTQEVEDIISSDIVKDSIINNSDCKILLDQRKFMYKFDGIQSLLGLTEKEKVQILSINRSFQPGRGTYREVWFGWGGTHSAVYATEVSLEEHYCYTTEEKEKVEVKRRQAAVGGNLELALKQLAFEKRESQSPH